MSKQLASDLTKVKMHFHVEGVNVNGQVYVVGSAQELGGWNIMNAVPMTTSIYRGQYGKWSASVDVDPNQRVYYKYLVLHPYWEAGADRERDPKDNVDPFELFRVP